MQVGVRALQPADLDFDVAPRPADRAPASAKVLEPAPVSVVVRALQQHLEDRPRLVQRLTAAGRAKVLDEGIQDEGVAVEDLAVATHASGEIGLPEEPSVLGIAKVLEQEGHALLGRPDVVAQALTVGVGEGPGHPALGGELLLVRREQVAAVAGVDLLGPPGQCLRAELIRHPCRLGFENARPGRRFPGLFWGAALHRHASCSIGTPA